MKERILEKNRSVHKALQGVTMVNPNPESYFPYLGPVRLWGVSVGDSRKLFLKDPSFPTQTYHEDNIYRMLGVSIRPLQGILTVKYLDFAERTHTQTFNLTNIPYQSMVLFNSVVIPNRYPQN